MTIPRGPAHRTVRLSPFIRDLAVTTFTSIATIVALVAMTRVLAQGLGPDGFGAYMLARRILSAFDPLSTLMMAVALTRYVALGDSSAARGDYLLAGTVLGVAPAAAVMVATLAAPQFLAVLFFRRPEYAPLIRATGWMVFGYSWFTVLYAWYRGVDRMMLANVWQLAAIALGPLVVAAAFNRPGGEAWFVFWTGGLLFAAAIPVIVELGRAIRHGAVLRSAAVRSLCSYAVPRVPGGLAFGGLLAIGPFLAPYYGTLREVGYVAVGQSILRVVEGGTEAFGRVALPKMSRLVATDGVAALGNRIADVVAVILHLGLFATGQLWLWADELTRVWLGSEYLDAVPAIRAIILGILPYLAFVTLRSIIDAIEEKAVNTVNLYASLFITTVCAIAAARAGYGATGLAAATTVGFSVLGSLTFAAVWRRTRFALGPLLLTECVAINAALFVAAALVRAWIRSSLPSTVVPVAALGVEFVLAAIYVASLWRLRVRWIDEFTRRVLVQETAG